MTKKYSLFHLNGFYIAIIICMMFSCKNNNSQATQSLPSTEDQKMDTIHKVEKVSDEKEEAMAGNFVYMADVALFTSCGIGKKLPVAMEGEYIKAERAYTSANMKNLEPMYIEVLADIENRDNGEGKNIPHLIIKKLIYSDTKKVCE